MNQGVGSQAVKLTISKLITQAISLLTTMLLSHYRTLEEYGTYSQMLLVINLVTTIFMVGLPNSINYFLAKTDSVGEKQKFISVYYTLSTLLSILAGLILVLSTPLIVNYFNNELIRGFWYVLAFFPWTAIIMSSIDNMLIVFGKVNWLMVYKIVNSLFILFSVWISQLFELSFKTYLWIYIIGQMFFTLSVYVMTYVVSKSIRFLINISLIKSVLIFTVPLALANVMGVLTAEIDKFVVSLYYSTEQVAIFTNAAREMPVSIVAASLTAILLPQLTRYLQQREYSRAVGLWGDSIIISYGFIAIIVFGLIAFAPDVMSFLYSDKYLSGVNVFRVYSVILLFRCTYFGMLLNAIGKTRFIFWSSLITLILDFLLNILFIMVFGFIGPAFSTLFATAVSAWLTLLVSARTIKFSLRDIFPWIDIIKITVVNVAFCIFFMIIKQKLNLDLFLTSLGESMLLGTFWCAIYLLIFFKKFKGKWKSINNV